MTGREDAARAVWPAIQQDVSKAKAAAKRRSAIIRWLFGLVVAALVFFVFTRPIFAAVIAGVSTLIFFLALVSPNGAHAAIEALFASLAKVVGTVLSLVLLAPVFYLFITPFGLLARRGRNDSLKRSLEPDAESYWQVRDPEDAGPALDRPY